LKKSNIFSGKLSNQVQSYWIEDLSRALPIETFSGYEIHSIEPFLNFCLRNFIDTHSFWEEVSKKAVDIFVASFHLYRPH